MLGELPSGSNETSAASSEQGLRHGPLGAVVAELAGLSMTASRRLQLAAEGSGVIGIAIRRRRKLAEAAAFGQPTAAVTRWRVSPLSPQLHCRATRRAQPMAA